MPGTVLCSSGTRVNKKDWNLIFVIVSTFSRGLSILDFSPEFQTHVFSFLLVICTWKPKLDLGTWILRGTLRWSHFFNLLLWNPSDLGWTPAFPSPSVNPLPASFHTHHFFSVSSGIHISFHHGYWVMNSCYLFFFLLPDGPPCIHFLLCHGTCFLKYTSDLVSLF